MKRKFIWLTATIGLIMIVGGCATVAEPKPADERVAYTIRVTKETNGTYLAAIKQQLDSNTLKNEITFNIPGIKPGQWRYLKVEKPYGTGPRLTLYGQDEPLDVIDGFGAKLKIEPKAEDTVLVEGVFVTDSDPSIKLVPLNLVCKLNTEKLVVEMR